jgi:alanine racemase
MHRELTRAWVEVDLGALRRNALALASRAHVPLLPMVKADAYGAGAERVAAALEPLHPWGFGVATVEEGEALRSSGVERPLVVFTPLLGEDLAGARSARLTPCFGRADAVARWARSGGGPWHLCIDTGMSRAGVRWNDAEMLHAIAHAGTPEGAYTHLFSAERADGSADMQERRFREAITTFGQRPKLLHVENGAAVERREGSAWDLVRPGIFLYGVGSGPGATLVPEPVVHVRARIVDLRTIEDGDTVSYGATYRASGQRRIATLSIGYADGYRRALSNRGVALLHGQRAPVAGIVTMDMTMLDVTDIPCQLGDVATLVGAEGGRVLTVDEVARTAEMSPYELLTGLRARLERLYVGGR